MNTVQNISIQARKNQLNALKHIAIDRKQFTDSLKPYKRIEYEVTELIYSELYFLTCGLKQSKIAEFRANKIGVDTKYLESILDGIKANLNDSLAYFDSMLRYYQSHPDFKRLTVNQRNALKQLNLLRSVL